MQVDSSGGGGCTGDTQGPVVTLTRPFAGSVYPSPNAYPVHFEASASDSTTGGNGVAFVEYKINYPGPDQLILGPVTSGAPWPLDWTQSAVMAYLGTACAKFLQVQAYAEDACGNATYSSPQLVTVNNTGPASLPDPGPAPDPLPGFRPETLRVVEGEVVQLAADSITFRLQGRPGERVVFAFRAGD